MTLTDQERERVYGVLKILIARAGGRVEITQEEATASGWLDLTAMESNGKLVLKVVPTNEAQ